MPHKTIFLTLAHCVFKISFVKYSRPLSKFVNEVAMERIQYISILLIPLVFLLVLAGCDQSVGPTVTTEDLKTTQEQYGIGATTAGTVDALFFSHLTASAAASESVSVFIS
jgi:hypothetical protein